MEIKIGDWVEIDGYKGYYQIINFVDYYAHEDDDYCNYTKGKYSNTVATLKQGFTSTMKFKLVVDQVDTRLLRKVSDAKFQEIQYYWEENPKDYIKYKEYTAGEKIGYYLVPISAKKKELEYWEMALTKLPQKFNMRQFYGWLYNNQGAISRFSEEEGMKGKKNQYYITFDLVKEKLIVGETPLYNNPRIVFGR